MSRTRIMRAALMIGLAGLISLVFSQQGRSQENPVSLTGVVKSAAGEKMEGVTVSARAQGKPFTTSVFTDKDGEYFFPPLTSGSYHVWAQARGYEAGRVEVGVNGVVRHQDFVLKETKDVAVQLTGDQWIASLPEQTAEDRRMKSVIRTLCVDCHTPSFPLQNRFDEKGWEKILTLMSLVQTGVGDIPRNISEAAPNPVINYYKPRLAAYLAKVRGPESSAFAPKLRPRPTGDATLAVITEYDAPTHAGYVDHLSGSDWSQGTPNTMAVEHHHVHDAIQDLNGNIWLTDTPGGVRSFAKVDAKTGKLTNFTIPGPKGAVGTHATARDDKGFVWITVESVKSRKNDDTVDEVSPGALARIDPKTDKFELFAPKVGPGAGGFVRTDAQGRLWANDDATIDTNCSCYQGPGIVMFDPETNKFKSFYSDYVRYSPEGLTNGYGATGDRQGNGWWALFSIDVISKANSDTGKVESIKLPKIRPEIESLFTGNDRKIFDLSGSNIPHGLGAPWLQGPRRPAADLHGDTVWFPMWFGNAVSSINISTKAMKQYPLPTNDSGPYELVVDDKHMVWAALQNADAVAKLDPGTGTWTQYDLPTLGAEIRDVAAVTIGGKTEVSVAYFRAGKVARLQFRTREEEQMLKNEVKKVAQER